MLSRCIWPLYVCDLATLYALVREVEIRGHFCGIFNNGASKDDIVEALVLLGLYTGLSETSAALAEATEVLGEFGLFCLLPIDVLR